MPPICKFLHRSFPALCLYSLLFLQGAFRVNGQTSGTKKLPAFSGTICDPEGHALAGVEVTLEGTREPYHKMVTSTDVQGHFEFASVPAGRYELHTDHDQHAAVGQGRVFDIEDGKPIALSQCALQRLSSVTDTSAAIPFSDEPQFTVAGVTDATALGVHASSRAAPNSNAVAKDTVALSHLEASEKNPSSGESSISLERSLRAKLAASEDADLRFELAEVEEKQGHSLEAEKDYQRAAELAPTEAHLFSWGAELLLHRAFEPALEVFGKGNQRYPRSVRMLLGLGATHYAVGSREDAAQYFLRAGAMDPADSQPYLFLGRLLPTQDPVPPAWTEAMKAFVTLHPENATAHNLYGLALAKSGEEGAAKEAEAQLHKAIALDAHLGSAYLELGILLSQRREFAASIDALQKAAEYTPCPDEAHYRLAQVYRRMGDIEKARQESALYQQAAEQKAQQAERERHEIQQFIYTLRSSTPPVQSPTPNPQ